MDKADGSIVIKVDADSKTAQKELDILNGKIRETEREIKKTTEDRASAKEKSVLSGTELDKEKEKLQEIKDRLQEINRIVKDKNESDGTRKAYQEKIPLVKDELNDQRTRVRMLQTEYNKIDGSVQRYDEKLRKANETLAEQKALAGKLMEKITTPEEAGDGSVDRAEKAAEKMQSIMSGLKTGAVGFAGGVRNILSGLASGFVSIAKGAATGLKKLNVFSRITDTLREKFKRLGSIVKRALIFNVISKGLTELRDGFSGYLKTNAEFVSALNRLKGALLTAFQPIYEAILPALTSLINGLTKAIAVIAQFVSALFGKTAKQSQENAKALNEQSKALEATGGAAEDAGKSMAAFDEINQLTRKETGGTGAANTDTDVPSFDFEADTTIFDSWGEAFNALLEKILNDGIPRIREGLLNFADWVNRFSENLYQMFTFPGVAEKVAMIGTEIALALNDMVAAIDWAMIGAAFGAGIQLALSLLVNFIWTFDWKNLGASVATMINNAVYEIDWYSVGQFLWSGFKIAIETLAGLLETLDMAELAKAASNIAIGFFDSITETINQIDWKKIGEQVETFLVNVDWSGVVKSVFTTIGSAIGALVLLLWGFIEDAWDEIVEWWNENAYEDGKFTIEGLLNGIWDGVKNIYNWIKENVVDPIINAFCDLLGINSPSTAMFEIGTNIIQGLLNGINSIINNVVSAFRNLWKKIRTWWDTSVSKFFTLDYWKDTGKKIIDGFLNGLKNAWTAVTDWVSGAIQTLKNAISSVFDFVSGKTSRATTSSWSSSGFGGSTSSYSLPAVPALARGAVIPANREFLAVLGDQKSGTNVEAPLSTIVQAVKQALAESSSNQTIVMEVNGREFGRVSFDLYNQESTRRGVKLGVK